MPVAERILKQRKIERRSGKQHQGLERSRMRTTKRKDSTGKKKFDKALMPGQREGAPEVPGKEGGGERDECEGIVTKNRMKK